MRNPEIITRTEDMTQAELAVIREEEGLKQQEALARIHALVRQKASESTPSSSTMRSTEPQKLQKAPEVTPAMRKDARGRDLHDRNALPDY